jgi:tetratricopeptide (TPR) repeat protein
MVFAALCRMNPSQAHGGALALEPMEAPTADGDAANGKRALRITIADDLLAEVAREYQNGEIDPDLWARAVAECGTEESLVIAAYLRARVRALQRRMLGEGSQAQASRSEDAVQRRKAAARAERQASRATPTGGIGDRDGEANPKPEIAVTKAAVAPARSVQPRLKYLAAAAAAFASAVAVVWVVASPRESEPAVQPGMSAAAPSPTGAVLAGQAAGAPSVGQPTGGTTQVVAEPTTAAMVQQLRDAGNWNVQVLYASKWTRDEPNNAAAWSDLSTGYANLRQFSDAVVAATKAAELAPADLRLWRSLGFLNVTLERLDEARSAFDHALALHADDADALCGAAIVAGKQGRTKDQEAIAGQVKSAGGSCPVASIGEAALAGNSVPQQPTMSVRR